MATPQQEHLKIEQLQQATPDQIEHIAGRERDNLEGTIPMMATDEEVREALEKAFDYRGDITVTRRDGSTVDGYLYDRRSAATLVDSVIRMIPTPAKGTISTTVERVNISYADVAGLSFSGRDTAAGKTFDAWVKKYWEKKAAGETNIQIMPEKLD
jgi:hypothetical protein